MYLPTFANVIFNKSLCLFARVYITCANFGATQKRRNAVLYYIRGSASFLFVKVLVDT